MLAISRSGRRVTLVLPIAPLTVISRASGGMLGSRMLARSQQHLQASRALSCRHRLAHGVVSLWCEHPPNVHCCRVARECCCWGRAWLVARASEKRASGDRGCAAQDFAMHEREMRSRAHEVPYFRSVGWRSNYLQQQYLTNCFVMQLFSLMVAGME